MVYDAIGNTKVSWARKTAPEIADVAQQDGSVLVVPIGSMEQHGYHLPVSTDLLLADAVATAGAEAVADEYPVLVAPPLYPGFSPHHMDFGGTLTLEFVHMLTFVQDTVTSALENGFDAVLLLNGHGGNIPLLGAATSTIGASNPDVSIYGVTYFEFAAPYVDAVRDSDPGGMGHAGEFETSLMLHLHPNLVDVNTAEGTHFNEPMDQVRNDMFEGGPVSVYRPFSAYTESGAIGDPELASAEKGEALLDGIRSELASLLSDVHEQTS